MKFVHKLNPLIEESEEEDVFYSILKSSHLSMAQPSLINAQQQQQPNSSLIINPSDGESAFNSSTGTSGDEDEIPYFIKASRQNGMNIIITYSLLYIIGSFGNLFVLYNILRTRYRSKMNFYIRQLAIADLIVINFTILTDIIWRITVRWHGGQLACKVVQLMRIFGLYLTSMVVICITVDRFFAFVFPLSVLKSKERNRHLLISAYVISIISSVPNVSGESILCPNYSHPSNPFLPVCVS